MKQGERGSSEGCPKRKKATVETVGKQDQVSWLSSDRVISGVYSGEQRKLRL